MSSHKEAPGISNDAAADSTACDRYGIPLRTGMTTETRGRPREGRSASRNGSSARTTGTSAAFAGDAPASRPS